MKHVEATKSIIRAAAFFLIFFSFISHPSLLGFLFAPDGHVDSPALTREINIFRALFGGFGLVLLFSRTQLARFLGKYPQLVSIGISVAATIFVIVGIEGILAFTNRSQGNATILEPVNSGGPAVVIDEVLGYKPLPLSQINARKSHDGRDLYNVVYSHDKYSRRIVPVENDEADNSALFFGGSFTYGEGVQDNETMPYFFSRYSENVKSLNLGYSGYGPQNMLAMLENDRIMRQISEELPEDADGCTNAIYTLIDHHVMRTVGSMSVMTYGQNMPYYRMNNKQKLLRNGTFASGRPFVTPFLRLLSHSQLLRSFKVELPAGVTDESLLLTAAVLDRSRQLLESRLGEANFTVLLYPGTKLASRIKPLLEKRHINVLDYSQADGWVGETMAIPVDLHPNGLGHRLIARKLAHDLDSFSCETNFAKKEGNI